MLLFQLTGSRGAASNATGDRAFRIQGWNMDRSFSSLSTNDSPLSSTLSLHHITRKRHLLCCARLTPFLRHRVLTLLPLLKLLPLLEWMQSFLGVSEFEFFSVLFLFSLLSTLSAILDTVHRLRPRHLTDVFWTLFFIAESPLVVVVFVRVFCRANVGFFGAVLRPYRLAVASCYAKIFPHF